MGQGGSLKRNQKYIELSENENTESKISRTQLTMRGKFIALYACFENRKSQINNLSSHLKNLIKEKQKKPSASRRKEILEVRNQ